MTTLRPALFLDRDGVINVDHPYVHRREQFEFIDGIFDLCRAARQAGHLLFVVTNQAGIGRGYYTERDFTELTDWMCARFALEGAPIDQVYHCPSHPTHGIGAYRTDSDWRKPAPGMILQAARDHRLDLRGSALIGNNESDIEAALAAGLGAALLFTPEVAPATKADAVLTRLADALPHLARLRHKIGADSK